MYFDIKGYFEKEADRLLKLNLSISKTVSVNQEDEQKKVRIKDYKKELSAFISSDINKASWRGAFVELKNSNLTSYRTDNAKIPVKKIEITYDESSISSIRIIAETTNILYASRDTLIYYPDSLYQIKKTQKIKWLKEKSYKVIGQFK